MYAQSIKWEDEARKATLLKQVPELPNQVINELFDSYRHPERFQLPRLEWNKFRVQFLNAMWGPQSNPFNKYPRMVKAFVFLTNSKDYFILPLVKNASDNKFYIFDLPIGEPQLLDNWIKQIQKQYGANNIRFNVCKGYANLPTDVCSAVSYQAETAYIYNNTKETNELNLYSAHRESGEQWKTKINRNMDEKSIYGMSVQWKDLGARKQLLNTVTTWPNYAIIKSNFEKMRNLRYFDDETLPGFLRRISWLYPDDGCWTRASAAIKDLFGPFNNTVNPYARPSKLFAFGNLCANTPNAPWGKVEWWYHTAPIVRDAETNQTYVLDPSVSPLEPIAVEKWMEAVASHTGACEAAFDPYVEKFNICNGYGASPQEKCNDPVAPAYYTNEVRHMLWQTSYRGYERQRQVDLGRDPNKVLGDNPPWQE